MSKLKKVLIGCGSLLVFIIVISIILGLTLGEKSKNPSNSPTETTPAPALQSYIIKEWYGTGIKSTESFHIENSPWAINWTNDPQMMSGMSVGMIQIYVYDTSNPNIPVTLLANTTVKTADTSYIYRTGDFYLTISAANTNWMVRIISQE